MSLADPKHTCDLTRADIAIRNTSFIISTGRGQKTENKRGDNAGTCYQNHSAGKTG